MKHKEVIQPVETILNISFLKRSFIFYHFLIYFFSTVQVHYHSTICLYFWSFQRNPVLVVVGAAPIHPWRPSQQLLLLIPFHDFPFQMKHETRREIQVLRLINTMAASITIQGDVPVRHGKDSVKFLPKCIECILKMIMEQFPSTRLAGAIMFPKSLGKASHKVWLRISILCIH